MRIISGARRMSLSSLNKPISARKARTVAVYLGCMAMCEADGDFGARDAWV